MPAIYNPSPSEIAAEAAKIRQGWSESQEFARRVMKPQPWMPPVVRVIFENSALRYEDFGHSSDMSDVA
jgi:hypothetical protein